MGGRDVVRYLLDTHVLLWLLGSPARVSDHVRSVLADRTNDVLVSAVSALEVSTKVRLGKLPHGRPLVDSWSARVGEIGGGELPISSEHAVLAGTMPWEHRDPFDRLLVAQAVVENVTLVTQDAAMQRLPGVRLLTW